MSESQVSNGEPKSPLKDSAQVDPVDNEKEQLALALKEKLKENKNLQNKNSKLETKYVDLFKEHKAIKKDHQAFTSLLKDIFSYDFEEESIGSYDLQKLRTLWRTKEENSNIKFKNLLESQEHQKNELEQSLQRKYEAKINKIQNQQQNIKHEEILKFDEEADELNQTIKNQQRFISELQKKLEERAQQISKVSKQKMKLEHELNRLKAKQIQKELKETNKDAIQKSNKERNEFLAMRQQVDSLLMQKEDLKRELKTQSKELETQKVAFEQSKEQIDYLTKKLSQKSNDVPKFSEPKIAKPQKASQKGKPESKEKERTIKYPQFVQQNGDVQLPQKMQKEYLHRQYFKNILLRYFLSLNASNYEQAEALVPIIATLLKLTGGESQILKIRSSWWNIL